MQIPNHFPQITLLPHYTSIYKLKRLSKLLNANIYIKRDDTNFLGGGGNKLRKLEFLLGEAISQNADTIITVGAWQSNHARLTAAASNYMGLNCELVLGKKVARFDDNYINNGNFLLDKILDVKVHALDKDIDVDQYAANLGKTISSKGGKPYIIPSGGSNPIGALGYVKCAGEIKEQEQKLGVNFDKIVVVNGSFGTHAGLVAGAKQFALNAQIHGYNVVRHIAHSFKPTLDLAKNTLGLCSEIQLNDEDIILDDSFLGSAYGQPTDEVIMAIRLLAKTEGLFLDPVYTGKAFAGLIDGIKHGKYKSDENILFMMTGGSPALYAYRDIFI